MNYRRRMAPADRSEMIEDLSVDLRIREQKLFGSPQCERREVESEFERRHPSSPMSEDKAMTEVRKHCDEKTCGKVIVFVETKNGKPMPVDPDYLEIVVGKGGDITVLTDGGDMVRGCAPVDEHDRVTAEKLGLLAKGRRSHFGTCTNPKRFSRKK